MRVLRVTRLLGELIGECTARCHNAPPNTPCSCVCGGELHGRGTTYALRHAPEIARKWQHGYAPYPEFEKQEVLFNDELEQEAHRDIDES